MLPKMNKTILSFSFKYFLSVYQTLWDSPISLQIYYYQIPVKLFIVFYLTPPLLAKANFLIVVVKAFSFHDVL